MGHLDQVLELMTAVAELKMKEAKLVATVEEQGKTIDSLKKDKAFLENLVHKKLDDVIYLTKVRK